MRGSAGVIALLVPEVDCGRRTRLLHCELEIGVDCALATYSGVELVVPKTACFIRQQETRRARCAGTVSSCCVDHGELSGSTLQNKV